MGRVFLGVHLPCGCFKEKPGHPIGGFRSPELQKHFAQIKVLWIHVHPRLR